MIVFGGIMEVTQELDDLCVLDLKKKQWTQLQMCSQNMTKIATRSKSPVRKLTNINFDTSNQ